MAMQSGMGLKQVDLDEFLQEFNSWQKHLRETSQENVRLLEKHTSQQKHIACCEANEINLKQELNKAREMVNKIQDTLHKRCDLEDENCKLQESVTSMKEDIAALTKNYEYKLLELETKIEDLKSAHVNNMEQLENSLQAQAELEKDSLNAVIDKHKQEIVEMQRQAVEQEKERQAELVKLRLEYDGKLLKLQKQRDRSQQHTAQMSGSNQDIFRKKLQHIRVESEREVANLKRTIAELEQKFAHNKLASSTNSFGSVQYMKRRF
ncbi:hypothetical protein NP493_92g01006 [Ridgeia piscesae]|uniref:Uncharacterized protein n=1 Tax=Ridgeia piscesae TaxID=27915 RepID=A0AAD9P880_RIDPI|nr:hypothetical protein NP493_92g01006 [Ridgeia piscesae]